MLHRELRRHPSTGLLATFLVFGGVAATMAVTVPADALELSAATSGQQPSAAVLPVRDTSLSQGHPRTTYAGQKSLRVAKGATALLSFQIPSVGDTLTSAKLCLTPTRSSTGRITVFTSSNSWTNRTTWATRPTPQTRKVGTASPKLRRGREVCVTVDSSLLSAGAEVSFRLAASGGTSYVGSRESASAPVLRLVAGVAGRTSTAPVTASSPASATPPSTKPGASSPVTTTVPKPITTVPKPTTTVPQPPATVTAGAVGSPATNSVFDASTTQAFKPATGFLGATSEFRRDVSQAPVNTDSAALVANLSSQVSTRYGGVAAFNVWNYNTTFYTATASTPRRNVIYDNCQGKSYVPAQLYTSGGGANFVGVPIPDQAVAATGSDAEMSVWDPATDQLWEFWKAKKQLDGWHACWGGRIDSFSTSPGFFPSTMGVSATGLSVAAGSIGIAEMQAGTIDHAMDLKVVDAANWRTFSYPAQRSDGSVAVGTPHAIPEGMRFRLDPALDVSTLNLTPIARAVAVAAQKYGFVVCDKGGAVAVVAESGSGVLSATGTDPWNTMMKGVPSYSIMRNFPWNRLQALPMDYGKP